MAASVAVRASAAHSVLCRVVDHADAAIIAESGAAHRAKLHRLGKRAPGGEFPVLLAHPLCKRVDERFRPLGSDGETLIGREAIDLALDG